MTDFEKEMKQLTEAFNHTRESEKSEQVIVLGIERARGKIKKNRRLIQAATVAAAVILLFFSSVKISPAFATCMAKIPGLHEIVVLINGDRGLEDAIDHHALQQLNLSETKGSVTLTINSMIADQNQMILFYTIKNLDKNVDTDLNDFDVKNTAGDSVVGPAEFDYSMHHKSSVIHDRLSISFNDKTLTDPLRLSMVLGTDSWNFTIPFNVKRLESMKKIYPIHQTAVLDRQKITFESMAIYPTRIAIRVKYDPDNTKKITHLDDLRLVDQYGHQWNPIDGLTSQDIGKNEQILYFQSNYFSEPKSLYLKLTRARAIDKSMQNITVDLSKKKLLKKPDDGRITLKSIQTGSDFDQKNSKYLTLKFALKYPKIDADNGYGIFDSEFTDQSGKHYTVYSEGTEMISNTIHNELVIVPNIKYKGLLTFKIIDYPSRIYGNVQIKIK